MMLKSLEDALADGDTIRAVIRNTGTNQDGNCGSKAFWCRSNDHMKVKLQA